MLFCFRARLFPSPLPSLHSLSLTRFNRSMSDTMAPGGAPPPTAGVPPTGCEPSRAAASSTSIVCGVRVCHTLAAACFKD